jgi:hypothetical protein
MQIDDIAVKIPAGDQIVLGDVIGVPTIVVLSRYFG